MSAARKAILSAIMKRAWVLFKGFATSKFAQALELAWREYFKSLPAKEWGRLVQARMMKSAAQIIKAGKNAKAPTQKRDASRYNYTGFRGISLGA